LAFWFSQILAATSLLRYRSFVRKESPLRRLEIFPDRRGMDDQFANRQPRHRAFPRGEPSNALQRDLSPVRNRNDAANAGLSVALARLHQRVRAKRFRLD